MGFTRNISSLSQIVLFSLTGKTWFTNRRRKGVDRSKKDEKRKSQKKEPNQKCRFTARELNNPEPLESPYRLSHIHVSLVSAYRMCRWAAGYATLTHAIDGQMRR